jgi:hypothetical protein
MDPEAAQAISAQIDPDETLLWADRPDTTIRLLYPLVLCLLIAARVYLSQSRSSTMIHGAIAVGVLVFLLSWFLNRHAFYGLTSRRAIVVASLFGRTRTRSASLVNLLEEPIVIRPGFLGRVIFGRSGKNRGGSPDDPSVGLVFTAVANAEDVCKQAQAAQQRMLDEIDARATARRPN